MKVEIVNGNLLDTEAHVIMHQTNCTFGFGSGVAKAIKDRWPNVAEEHHKLCQKNIEENNGDTSKLLGTVQPVMVRTGPWMPKIVMNLFAQNEYGYDGAKYTSYDALDTCLKKVAKWCVEHKIHHVALPYNMSCVRGGANWNVVMALIEAAFGDTDIEIEIRKLDLA